MKRQTKKEKQKFISGIVIEHVSPHIIVVELFDPECLSRTEDGNYLEVKVKTIAAQNPVGSSFHKMAYTIR